MRWGERLAAFFGAPKRDWNVSMNGSGRGSALFYSERANRLELWWEYGGNDVLLIVTGPPPERWASEVPWAADRRVEIMSRVASELIRTSAGARRFEWLDEKTTVLIRA